ncbi:MAG: PilZ domain-containing protein [Elusimicrobiota bacterium]|jgi:c-di-GMP-binding flagellar brake protein YcgR
MTSDERREFSRVTSPWQVDLMDGEQVLHALRTRDLSPKGFYAFCDNPWPEGCVCKVILSVKGMGPVQAITGRAKVVRVEEKGMGLEFLEVDLEQYEHLCRYVLYHAEDADRVQEELDQHIGLKRRSESDEKPSDIGPEA